MGHSPMDCSFDMKLISKVANMWGYMAPKFQVDMSTSWLTPISSLDQKIKVGKSGLMVLSQSVFIV